MTTSKIKELSCDIINKISQFNDEADKLIASSEFTELFNMQLNNARKKLCDIQLMLNKYIIK